MKKYIYLSLYTILSVFMMLSINACSDNSAINSYDKEITTTPKILVSFNTPITQDSQEIIGLLYQADADNNIIKLDGKGINATYAYSSPYELLIIPNVPTLKAHTDYKLSVDLSRLENAILKDSISLALHTYPTEIASSRFSVSHIDENTFNLNAHIELSQNIDMSELKNAIQSNEVKKISKMITLNDDKGKNIDFEIQVSHNELFLKSVNLPFEEDKSYTLTLKAPYFGFEKDEKMRYEQGVNTLEVVSIKPISAETPYIQIHFSTDLVKNPHLEDFITISPNIQTKISSQGNIVRIDAPFNLSQNYQVHIKEGLMGIGKSRMHTAKEDTIIFHQIPPALAFSQQGIFLPSNAQNKIAFKSINIKKVTLKVSKIYPNNITSYLYKQNLIGETQYNDNAHSYDDYDDYDDRNNGIYADFYRLGDEVLKQEFTLDMRKNEWIQSEIDLSALKDKKGIFILELNFDKDGVDYEFPAGTSSWKQRSFFDKAAIQKHLIFSDIALLAQQTGKDKLNVIALDIASNKPMSSVQISAINRKNQAIATLNTDSQGSVVFDNASSIMYLNASKDEDNTILRLNSPLSTEGFDIAGLVQEGNTSAYIYTDRGVYRPGESAHINIIARADSKPITHPIYINITSPQGKLIVENMALKEQLFGLFSYTFETQKNAPSGIYQLETKIGGSTFWHNISVENVVPNRIKVEIQSPEQISAQKLEEDDGLRFSLQSKYLFGAPASHLDFTTELFIKEVNFYAPSYSDYTFNSPLSLQYRLNDSQKSTLDSNGEAKIHYQLDDMEDLGRNLRASLYSAVFENGGRKVSAAKNMDIILYESFVGIKAPKSRYIDATSAVNLPIIVLSHDTHKPISGHKLTYRIYHSSYSWWWDYSNYDEFVRSIKSNKNTKLLKEGTLTSKPEPITLSFTPNQSGELFIEVEDEENHTKSAISLYASEYGEPTLEPKLTQLKLQSDKQQYLATDKAKISFESTKDSKALVTIIGQNEVLERFWVDTNDGQTQVNIPLKSSYAPNVYVAITLLQNYHTLDNDRSQRLYGVIPLNVEDADSKLTLQIDAPQSIRPNTEFSVNLSNKENKKVAYTLAVVDEGLLDLTNFISPNPWKHFYQKLALTLSVFDNYDMIIGRNIGKIQQILKVGGDELAAGAARKDLNQAQRFKPIAFYAPPTMSDDKGRAKFTYTMPAYMGSVRIMAVALNDKSYGGASQNMQVSAPVVMLPTIPRSLKLGDTFTLAIEVLPTQDKVGKVTLNLKSGDKIKFDKTNFTLQFNDKTSQMLQINAQVSEEHIGQDFIDISLSSKDFSMQEKTEIDILPYNPYTTLSKKFMLEPKSSLTLENPKEYVKGSQNGYVLVSQTPILSIDHRLKWLIRYPYGCIEQTTSSVLPQLFITSLSKGDFIDKPTITRNINAGIARIGNFQTSDGGFSYWQGQSQSDAWGSAYAGHFLLLAKSQGYYVPESVLKKWINYEKDFVKTANNPLAILYPLYLLSLAGEPQIGLLNDMYEHYFSNLEVSDKWLLAAAYKLAGLSSMAEKITKDLPTRSTSRSESYYRFSYGSMLRDDAMILQAYVDIYKNPHKALLDLVIQRLESNEWYSTQTLGYSLLALSSAMPANTNSSDNAIDIVLNKQSFKANKGVDSIKIPFDELQGQIKSNNTFALYINQVWDGILLEKDIQPKAQKIALSRSFLDEKGNAINIDSLPSGSTFYLKLTLYNANERVSVDNVAITQNLPSGWEIENTRLTDTELPSFVSQRNITYTDIKDDKIMWFVDYYGNDIVMFAKINTITPGNYLLPPATAEAMYDNSFLANTESKAIAVTSREER